MIKNKLFRLVSVLHEEEKNEVTKFIQSKLQDPTDDSFRLWKLLRKEGSAGSTGKDVKALLFQKLYGKKAEYDDAKMRKLMSRLCVLLERYLIMKRLDQKPAQYSQLLVESLETRSDYGLFMEFVEERLAELERLPYRGRAYFEERANLYRTVFFHQETVKVDKGLAYLSQYISDFDKFFIITTLQNGIEWLSQKGRKTESARPLLLDATAAAADGLADEKLPKLFLDLYRLYAGHASGVVDLSMLRSQVEQSLPLLEEIGQRMALKSAINYAIKCMNLGHQHYRRFLFEMYRIGMQVGLLVHGDNSIPSLTFINILSVAVTEGEFGWARAFLDENGKLVKASERETTIHYCQAYYHYKLGVNKQSVSLLEDAFAETQLIPVRTAAAADLRVRLLQMRIKFQLFEWGKDTREGFFSHARTFTRFLQGNTVYPETVIGNYLKLLNYVKRLARLMHNSPKKPGQVASFKEEIVGQDILLKEWLLEKVEELLPKRPSAF